MIIIAIRILKVSFHARSARIVEVKDGYLQVSLMRMSYRKVLIKMMGGNIYLL